MSQRADAKAPRCGELTAVEGTTVTGFESAGEPAGSAGETWEAGELRDAGEVRDAWEAGAVREAGASAGGPGTVGDGVVVTSDSVTDDGEGRKTWGRGSLRSAT
ncbi:hypothetical protein Aca07nite_15380 [Actinoplanes capillaceus]|uniref:Uncharacterized protein n=1 Tax=Actinoplanes campanulatus TaxID=113559 RepID=A0ABQ3WFB0_9ACTN|nr:hypothetical protein Aca07nite_15380 [Actinoplanes capillaceus]